MSETLSRLPQLLEYAAHELGILPLLEDPDIREIRMVSGGRCFAVSTTRGIYEPFRFAARTLDVFLRFIAHHHGQTFDATNPILSTGDILLGFRVHATRPPVSPDLSLVLRKHPRHAFTLPALLADGVLTPAQLEVIQDLLDTRRTCVIAGPMASGKTTLLNSALAYLTFRNNELGEHERFAVLEDTPEVVCMAPDTEYYRTVDTLGIDLTELGKSLLRTSAQTVVIGEVRGGEVLDALKACQTGCRGLMTIHAKSAEATFTMLEQRIQEASQTPQQHLIGDAVDAIIHMAPTTTLFHCTEVLWVKGWTRRGGYECQRVDSVH